MVILVVLLSCSSSPVELKAMYQCICGIGMPSKVQLKLRVLVAFSIVPLKPDNMFAGSAKGIIFVTTAVLDIRHQLPHMQVNITHNLRSRVQSEKFELEC